MSFNHDMMTRATQGQVKRNFWPSNNQSPPQSAPTGLQLNPIHVIGNWTLSGIRCWMDSKLVLDRMKTHLHAVGDEPLDTDREGVGCGEVATQKGFMSTDAVCCWQQWDSRRWKLDSRGLEAKGKWNVRNWVEMELQAQHSIFQSEWLLSYKKGPIWE